MGLARRAKPLEEYAAAADSSDALRQAAIDGLAALGGQESRGKLDELARDEKAPGRRDGPDRAGGRGPGGGGAATRRPCWKSLPNGDGAAEVYDAFLERKNGANLLAAALAGRKLSADTAKVGVRAVRISGREAPALTAALDEGGRSEVRGQGADGGRDEGDGRRRANLGQRGPRRGHFPP